MFPCMKLLHHGHSAIGGVLLATFVLAAQVASAVEVRGTVSRVAAGTAEVATDSSWLPQVGDKAEVFFELKALKTTALISAAKVTALKGSTIVLGIDDPEAKVKAGHLVKINSPNPTKRSEAPPASSAPPVNPPASITAVPPPPGTLIVFDTLRLGPKLAADAFAPQGVTLEMGQDGDARIESAGAEMVLPPGRRQLLMVVQNPRTSEFSLVFKQPMRRVTITRIGVTRGASLPKWQLSARNAAGNMQASTGENDWSSDAKPRDFTVEADGIDRIDIFVDNRHGAGTFATYSCLPIAEIHLEPAQPGGAGVGQSSPPPAPAPPSDGIPSREAPSPANAPAPDQPPFGDVPSGG